MSLNAALEITNKVKKREFTSHADGLWGWLYQNEVKGKVFVTKGFFLRKRDSDFLGSLKQKLSGHFDESHLNWLTEANAANTRLGFLFLYVQNREGVFAEGATFSLLLASKSDPKVRDWYEVSLEPAANGDTCRISLHFANLTDEGHVQHKIMETVLEAETSSVLSLLDQFVEMAYLDIDRQWENWSHWWFKEALSLPFKEPTRFQQKFSSAKTA
ncbi:MAG: hypothetical protein WCI18_11420 [Pseudomonadota bacterium]